MKNFRHRLGAPWRLATLALALTLAAPLQAQVVGRAARATFDTERGGYFTYPFGDQWNRFGAEFARTNFLFDQMPASAPKGLHGRLQHFAAVDNPPNGLAYFPWTEFLAYDADEVARGRPSMVMTATYQGTKRPLYFSYGSFDPSAPFQAVHVRDDRFVKFWIKNYALAVLSQPYLPGRWIGADNSTFRYDLYGVLDNSGSYVQNIPWDAPYPQNDAQWVDAVLYMLGRVKEWAPNIRIACNDVGLNEPQAHRQAEFNQVVSGVIREDFWYLAGGGSDWYRHSFYQSLTRDITRAAAGLMEVLNIQMSPSDTTLLRRSWMAYLIIGGDNLFFGPKDSASRELNPALWADMRNRLGRPVSPATSAQEPGRTIGHRLYWRECEGGICYLNWTGAIKTVTPPAGRTYYDRNGNQVTSINIADMQGDYVLFSPAARVSWPAIHPRHAGPVSGPLAVTLDMDPVFGSGATIRYTTDGLDPTASSPTYTAPIAVSASATVKARAFKAGLAESFVHAASYTFASAPPAVEFHLAGDQASEFLARDYPLVKLGHVSAATVQVSYSVTGGTATSGADYTLAAGTLTFPPGEQYRTFPVAIVNDSTGEANETIVITLSNPVNAALGARSTYTYTIEDNDGGANQPPSVAIVSPTNGSTISLPAGLTLTASVNDDSLPSPPTVSLAWSKLAGPGTVVFSAPNALTTGATFSLPGSYGLRCTVSDGLLSAVSDIAIQVRDSFAAWAARSGAGGDGSDADWDGLTALGEYALVGDPVFSDATARVSPAVAGGRLALRFERDPLRTDLTIGVWGADEMAGPWTELASSIAGAPFGISLAGAGVTESASGDFRSVEVRDVFPLGDPGRPRRFLQVRIER
jgi:Chitobiase/beta-hexosaminidase C-terminal domain/Calx-beta domain